MSQVKLTVKELQQLKWLLGGVLALLSFWALSSLDIGGSWILLLAASLSVAVLVAPGLTARIPPLTWKVATPVIVLLVGADVLTSIPDFIPALVRMVVYLLAYRMLAPRQRREDLQLVLLCLFCLVIAGVLTVSVLFAVQIILFTPVAMGLLFAVNLLDREIERENLPGLWEAFSWGHLIGRVWAVMDFRILSLGAALFATIVALSTLIFVFTPRIDLQQAIPMMQMATQARSGFSEQVSIGSVSDIVRDNSVAFRVDVPSFDAVDEVPYWRMLVLDRYREGSFEMSPLLQSRAFRKMRESREFRGWGVAAEDPGGEYWTFYLEGGISKYLPLPGSYESLRFQGAQDLFLSPELYLANLDSVRQSVLFYQVKDLRWGERFPASIREVEAFRSAAAPDDGDAVAPDGPARYPLTTLELEVPADDAAYLSGLADAVRASAPADGAEAFAREASRHLMEKFRYSLSPDGDPGDGDPFVRWLRTGTRGHCEYFAGSLVLILRAAGYPARLVVGFTGGSWNSVEDYFVARNSDAHAWAEVFDAGSGDWVRIDPTPGTGSSPALAGTRGTLSYEQGWLAWTDSLRIQWYRRIVDFDEASQAELFAAVKTVVKELTQDLKAGAKRFGRRVLDWVRMPWGLERLDDGVYLILGASLCALLWWGRSAFGRMVRRVLHRPAPKDPVRLRAGRLLVRMKEARSISGDGLDEMRWLALKGDLDRIRYGPEAGRGGCGEVFSAVRRFLRRSG